MRVNEVVSEGVFQDLATIGRQRNAEIGQKIGSEWSGLKQQVGGAVSSALGSLPGAGAVQQKAAEIKKLAQDTQVRALAKNIATAWENEVKRITANQTAPMQTSEYQQKFATWLEQMMHGEVAVSENNPEFQKYITGATPQVYEYLANYFVPAYQSLKTPTAPQIPNGTRVVVRGAQAGQVVVPDEIYTWKDGRWHDSAGGAVTAGSKMHQGLTADAMTKLKGSSATTQTI